jgi:hypothetical protein
VEGTGAGLRSRAAFGAARTAAGVPASARMRISRSAGSPGGNRGAAPWGTKLLLLLAALLTVLLPSVATCALALQLLVRYEMAFPSWAQSVLEIDLQQNAAFCPSNSCNAAA